MADNTKHSTPTDAEHHLLMAYDIFYDLMEAYGEKKVAMMARQFEALAFAHNDPSPAKIKAFLDMFGADIGKDYMAQMVADQRAMATKEAPVTLKAPDVVDRALDVFRSAAVIAARRAPDDDVARQIRLFARKLSAGPSALAKKPVKTATRLADSGPQSVAQDEARKEARSRSDDPVEAVTTYLTAHPPAKQLDFKALLDAAFDYLATRGGPR